MGGAGGAHLLALTRLGIGGFHIADFDTFDLVNFNRQAGANMGTIGQPKVDVLAAQALAINPELRLTRFPNGVTVENLDAFLGGCDLFVDGLDFFALDIRARVFRRCEELGIPAVTAAPIGMGAGFLAFLPGGQTFEQYFRLEGQPEQEQYLRFLMGVAPAGLHRAYLVDDTRVDIAGRRGPSTGAACELCAAVVATQALKLLLGRGRVPAAPVHMTIDAYVGRTVYTRQRWGMAGPLPRLKLAVARRVYGAMAARAASPAAPASPALPAGSVLHAILGAARWAPSGDNTQPWQFETVDPAQARVRIHLGAGPAGNPYEYRGGEPILLAGGMLLESLRIAASAHGRRLHWQLLPAPAPEQWLIEAEFPPDPAVNANPLLAALPMRSVERRALRRTPLPDVAKHALQDALGPALTVTWHESARDRLALARLGAAATAIRLRAPEAFAVHQKVVDWQRPHSPDGLPARAIGLDRATLRLMRWGMGSWGRMRRLNQVLGTAGAAAQLDILPGLRSAAFFSVRRQAGHPTDAATLLRDGEHLQRFWLTATRLGLGLQPALATLIFADHGARKTPFTTCPACRRRRNGSRRPWRQGSARSRTSPSSAASAAGQTACPARAPCAGRSKTCSPQPAKVARPAFLFHKLPSSVMNDQTTGCSRRIRSSTVSMAPTAGCRTPWKSTVGPTGWKWMAVARSSRSRLLSIMAHQWVRFARPLASTMPRIRHSRISAAAAGLIPDRSRVKAKREISPVAATGNGASTNRSHTRLIG